MKLTDCPTPTILARRLGAWLDGETEDSGERQARTLMAWVLANALGGHFGYFKFVLDAVDGKRHLTAEFEPTWEAGCVVIADDRRDETTARAA
jgi:hypothetical protein